MQNQQNHKTKLSVSMDNVEIGLKEFTHITIKIIEHGKPSEW